MKQLFVFFSLFFCALAFGQKDSDLILEYDLFNNVITYKKNGQTILKPSVREGDNIYVNVVEFNPYIMKAEVIVKQIDYEQSSLGLAGGELSEGSGGGFSGLSGLLGGLKLGSSIQSAFGGVPGSRGEVSEAALNAKQEFADLTEELNEVENSLNNAYKKLELFKTTSQSQQLALADINDLKTNEYLKPSRIKELIEEEINYSFAKSKGEDIVIDDLVNSMKKEEDIKNSVEEYNTARLRYIALADKWENFSKSIASFIDEEIDQQFEFIHNSSDSIKNEIKKNATHKFSKAAEIAFSKDFSEKNISLMATLRQAHEEMKSNIFTYSFPPVQAQNDEVSFEIVISKNNGVNIYKEYKKLKQTIPVEGGWKISGGLGLAFGKVKNKTYGYSVINNKIVGDELDDFVPLFVSFAHAYKKTIRNINFGGSFGIGFPLQSGATVQSATFFAGPTMIVGKSQRFLLTAGLMGAKVNRLASGFKVGDTYDSISNNLPLAQKYELGYFISLSYDILRK